MTDLSKYLTAMPIVAILRGLKPDEAVDMGEALVSSGICILEVPLNSPDPFNSIEKLARALSGRAIVGAGTVINEDQVDQLADVGGQVSVSPNMNPDVIRRALQHKIEPFPGVFSPTEVFDAVEVGAKNLKLFPGGVLGPTMSKAIKDVLPDGISMFAVGGVGVGNLGEWFDAGITGVGIGGGLYKPGDSPKAVALRAKSFTQKYFAIKNS